MILIALGANLSFGSSSLPVHTCDHAIDALKAVEGLEFAAVSHWYRTKPMPPDVTQPDYCNGAALFFGAPDPAKLLDELHRIEAAFGRVRSVPNAARTLDLDLIDVNGVIRNDPPPQLPHPRAHLRAFVLRPVLDVAPDWVHPVSGRPVAALLDGLTSDAGEEITRW